MVVCCKRVWVEDVSITAAAAGCIFSSSKKEREGTRRDIDKHAWGGKAESAGTGVLEREAWSVKTHVSGGRA